MTPIMLRIEELRAARNWSQAELARRSGIPQATISRIEARKTAGISFDTLEKLAYALGCDPGFLIVREEEMTYRIQRQVVSRERLLELLNEALHDEALHRQRVSEDCRFKGPLMVLQEPDETGCNWSDNVQIRRSGNAELPSLTVLARALLRVRRRYNLSE